MTNLRSLSALSLGWLFSSSGRALALPATDAAVLEARRLARRGSDKRSSRSSLTWISPHHRSIFCWEKNRNRSAVDSRIFQIQKRASLQGVGKINDQVTVISIDHLPRYTPLFYGAARGGPAARSNVDAMQSADV